MAQASGAEADERDSVSPESSVVVERRGKNSALCKWSVGGFSKVKARALWSRYFDVGGYDCRLLLYPKGDSQALPGYVSIYLQVTDPCASAKWDCFASYRLSVVNQRDDSKSIARDSWHRFSGKKKSHGWCDFTPSTTVMDPKSGFVAGDTLVVTTEILVLDETVSFIRDEATAPSSGSGPSIPEVHSGRFLWKVRTRGPSRDRR
eukprot:1183895-Prorocentrum_minimum.AAC.4